MLLGYTWVPHNSSCLIIDDRDGAWRVESGPITVYLFRQSAWHMSKVSKSSFLFFEKPVSLTLKPSLCH